MALDADDDAAEHIDGGDDDTGDGVTAHEFRGSVHGAEESTFLLQLAAAPHRLLFVDQPGIEVGIDGHLFARDGIEREARADLGDTRRALGDDQEIYGNQNYKHDRADHEVTTHHEIREAGDDVTSRCGCPRCRAKG